MRVFFLLARQTQTASGDKSAVDDVFFRSFRRIRNPLAQAAVSVQTSSAGSQSLS